MKAAFFLLRALQDGIYSVWLQTQGATGFSAVKDSTLKDGRPARRAFDEYLPGYVDWFGRFKRARNDLRLGAAAYPAGKLPGPRLALLSVFEVNGDPPSSSVRQTIYRLDLTEAVVWSTRFLNFAVSTLQAPNIPSV